MESGKKSPPKRAAMGAEAAPAQKRGKRGRRGSELLPADLNRSPRRERRDAGAPLKKTACFRYNAEKAESRDACRRRGIPGAADRCAGIFEKAGAAWTATNPFERRRKDGACPSAWFRNCVQRAAFRGRRNSAAPGRSPRTPPSRRTCAGPGTGRGTNGDLGGPGPTAGPDDWEDPYAADEYALCAWTVPGRCGGHGGGAAAGHRPGGVLLLQRAPAGGGRRGGALFFQF